MPQALRLFGFNLQGVQLPGFGVQGGDTQPDSLPEGRRSTQLVVSYQARRMVPAVGGVGLDCFPL